MRKSKVKLLAIAAILAILMIVAILQFSAHTARVCFGGKQVCINAEIADTPEERAKGLMFRTELAEMRGMIFIFESEDSHSFWMKNTLIPLDILWIDSNLNIVHIEHAVPCNFDPCKSYKPAAAAKYVVEVISGFAEKYKVTVGDGVSITL